MDILKKIYEFNPVENMKSSIYNYVFYKFKLIWSFLESNRKKLINDFALD
jgi:hypothetical protein